MVQGTTEAPKRAVAGARALEDYAARLIWPVTLAAAGLAAVSVLLLVARSPSITAALYRHGDVAAAPVLAELVGEARGDYFVVVGNYAWYEPLWFMSLTRGLPAHRELWILAPWAFTALGILAAAWAAWKVSGRWAAVALLALIVPLSESEMIPLGGATQHGHTFVHTGLLAAFVVLVAKYGSRWSARRLALGSVAAALVTAPGVASDVLMWPAALLPLVVAAGAAVAAGLPRRVPLALAGVAGGAAVAGAVIHRIAQDSGLYTSGTTFPFDKGDELPANSWLLVQTLAVQEHGNFFGRTPDAGSVFALACAVLAIGLAAWAIAALRRRLRSRAAINPSAAALLAFWATSAVASAAAFVLSSAPTDPAAVRYVVWVWPGLATIAVILATATLQRVAIAGIAAVLAVGGIIDTANFGTEDDNFAPGDEVAALQQFAKEQRFSHGYGGPWDANNITWQTEMELQVYPVQPCNGPNLCKAPFHTVSTSYEGKPGARTFIVASNRPTPSGVELSEPEPAIFDKPAVVTQIGELHVYGYDYDVATRMEGR